MTLQMCCLFIALPLLCHNPNQVLRFKNVRIYGCMIRRKEGRADVIEGVYPYENDFEFEFERILLIKPNRIFGVHFPEKWAGEMRMQAKV